MPAPQCLLYPLTVVVVHPQLAQRHRRVARVEHAQDRRLAGDERDGHDADVDLAAVEGERHPAVLRGAALGDVELAEDLDARDDAGGLARRDARDVAHHAVDAVADEQLAVLGIEVDVGGAVADRLRDDRAHEPDGWAVVGGLLERGLKRRVLLLGLGLLVVDEVAEAAAAGQQRVEAVARDDDRDDVAVRQHRDVVGREQVARVGHRDDQRAVLAEADRDCVEALHRGLGDGVQRREVGLDGLEVDELQPEALGDRDAELVVAQPVALEQELAHRAARGARLADRILDGLAVAEAELDDDVAEQPAGADAPCWFLWLDLCCHLEW